MKKFVVDKKVFEALPGYCLGVLVAKGIENDRKNEKIESMLKKKEPNKWPSVELMSADKRSDATIEMKFKILSISELGLVLKSSLCPHEGDVFQVHSNLFTELELEAPLVKVISVHNSASPTEWIVKTHFFGAKDQFLQHIRSWMYQALLKKVV